jgi:hypothetical protein
MRHVARLQPEAPTQQSTRPKATSREVIGPGLNRLSDMRLGGGGGRNTPSLLAQCSHLQAKERE